MLTVITSDERNALTTISDVVAMLGLQNPDTEVIDKLIPHASAAVVDFCRRSFGRETVQEDFVGPDTDAVLLGRDPVVEIVELRDGDEIVPGAGYRFDAATGLLRRVSDDGHAFPWLARRLSVTYRAGYVLPGQEGANLPPPIERATIQLVGAYLSLRQRDPLIKSETTEGIGSTSWYVPGASSVLADPEAEQLLRPYRRLF